MSWTYPCGLTNAPPVPSSDMDTTSHADAICGHAQHCLECNTLVPSVYCTNQMLLSSIHACLCRQHTDVQQCSQTKSSESSQACGGSCASCKQVLHFWKIAAIAHAFCLHCMDYSITSMLRSSKQQDPLRSLYTMHHPKLYINNLILNCMPMRPKVSAVISVQAGEACPTSAMQNLHCRPVILCINATSFFSLLQEMCHFCNLMTKVCDVLCIEGLLKLTTTVAFACILLDLSWQ